MCGRYTLGDKKYAKVEFSHFSLQDHGKNGTVVKPNFNVAPTQLMPVITNHDGHRQLELMYWGIPRSLGKDHVKEIINTRSEKAFERFWGSTVLHKRCLVPASGFYEWQTQDDGKHPYFIKPKDQHMFAFAGIWSEYTNKEGHKINSYSIMTTEPNSDMKTIHTRMPVILHNEDYDKWLTATDERDVIEPLLRPYEDNGLEMYEVSKAVNNVRTNTGDLLTPVNSK